MDGSKKNKGGRVPPWIDGSKKYYRYDIYMKRPKRPLSAYKLWLKSIKDQEKAESPGLEKKIIDKKHDEIWNAMKPEEKRVWLAKALKAKEKYRWNMEEYEYNKKQRKIEEHGFNLMYGCDSTSDSDVSENETEEERQKCQYENHIHKMMYGDFNAKDSSDDTSDDDEQDDSEIKD